jgi:type II secretory pathway component PulF
VLTLDELLALNAEIAALVRAGVPLEQGLVVLMVAVFLFLYGYVAVEMKQVFRDYDCALPPITRVFLWFSGSKAWLSAGLAER